MVQNENAKVVFEQYWLHARHVENERLHVTNLLLVIFAALLAFISATKISWELSSFGLITSLFGLLMVHATRVPFLRYSRMAEAIMATELAMDKYRRFYSAGKQKGLKPVLDKSWGVHRIYVGLFTTSAAGWCGLIAYSLGTRAWVTWAVAGAVAIVLPIIYYFVFGTRENSAGKELARLQSEVSETK